MLGGIQVGGKHSLAVKNWNLMWLMANNGLVMWLGNSAINKTVHAI